MGKQTLCDIAQPTEADIVKTRKHPAYLEAAQALKTAGKEIHGQSIVPLNSEEMITSARNKVASDIKRGLRPLHEQGTEHLGVKIESEINETYSAQVQALVDAGYDSFNAR